MEQKIICKKYRICFNSVTCGFKYYNPCCAEFVDKRSKLGN